MKKMMAMIACVAMTVGVYGEEKANAIAEKKDSKEMKSLKVEQVTLPELKVASFRRVGPYGDGVGEAFSKLTNWAGKNNVFTCSTLVIGIYYDCPKSTEPEKCRMDACVTLTPEQKPSLEEGIAVQTLSGGLYATYLSSVYNNDFASAWGEFKEWLNAHNAVIDRACPQKAYF